MEYGIDVIYRWISLGRGNIKTDFMEIVCILNYFKMNFNEVAILRRLTFV